MSDLQCPARIFLVRLADGIDDSAAARGQVATIARSLRTEKTSAVYHSPEHKSRTTAQLLAATLQVPALECTGLQGLSPDCRFLLQPATVAALDEIADQYRGEAVAVVSMGTSTASPTSAIIEMTADADGWLLVAQTSEA